MLLDTERGLAELESQNEVYDTMENFELPKNKECKVTELLESKDINDRTRNLLNKLLKVDQRFGEIMLVSNNIDDDPNTGGGIIIDSTADGFQISIELSVGDKEALNSLLESRPEAVVICKELLNTDSLTPEQLQDFIVAHEFGHAFDFLNNYADQEDSVKQWREHREAILESLPVPGLTPAELKTEIETTGVDDAYPDQLYNFFREYNLVNSSRLQGIGSVEDLLMIQERAYRSSPRENFADAFATKILQS